MEAARGSRASRVTGTMLSAVLQAVLFSIPSLK